MLYYKYKQITFYEYYLNRYAIWQGVNIVAEKKQGFFMNHRTPCPTCEGRTCIVCCSVEDNTECETIVCPTCGGKGYLVDRNKFWIKIGMVIVAAVIVGNIIFWKIFG